MDEKEWHYVKILSDITLKLITLFSVYKAVGNKPNIGSLACIWLELIDLFIWFILQAICTVGSAGQFSNK